MDARLGLKVRLPDPENPANVVTAQFATIRGHGEMKALMDACARAEVEETVELRRVAIAQEALESASSPQAVDEAADALRRASDSRIAATGALLDAIRAFVVGGFELAGAPRETAEQLASIVGPEQLAELRVKCQFGAGALDFTQAAAR